MNAFSSPAFTTKKALAKERLLQAIRAGRYRPGERLRQNQIARDLGLSSTPVREALTDLVGSGLVTYEQHCGVRVAEVEPERVSQVYRARMLIEGEIAKLAFDHMGEGDHDKLSGLVDEMDAHRKAGRIEALMAADEQFHLTILEACGNPYLVGATHQLWDGFPRYFVWLSEERMAASMGEHRRMVEALVEGNKATFLKVFAEHLENSLALVLAYVAKQEDQENG